ncbi:spectrin beta chain-like isoform X2 [Anthonomus grandis grandis]|uniref:spectrin beta chain-like isoform X2 n=1 Tax=Anthonomus grandis grandis TaxID=2921223 RepID=UPI0021669D35|nr:spectrin beta chain-like isoform X2 [Anthonomus grandis grandis]
MNVEPSQADLQEQKEIQKKTFKRWLNSHLKNLNLCIKDNDLCSGKNLTKFLKALAKDENKSNHCLKNIDKAVQYLENQGINLEIKENSTKVPLMLIWTTILHFQIQNITIKDPINQETKYAKKGLLLWCQIQTANYRNVKIENFTTSWTDGLAFNALIHKHRPDLIEFDHLTKNNPMYNLINAFNIAEKKLELPKLLDAEDMALLDEISIMTYVVTYYDYFNKKINHFVASFMEIEGMIEEFEGRALTLHDWIGINISKFNNTKFSSSITEMKQLLGQLRSWQIEEKLSKMHEKEHLEIMFNTLRAKMRAYNQLHYTSKLISGINKAWVDLEKAEHQWDLKLRKQIRELIFLNELATQFHQKCNKCEIWLEKKKALLSSEVLVQDFESATKASQKYEAFEEDIKSYGNQIDAVRSLADKIDAATYSDKSGIIMKKQHIISLWGELLELVENRKLQLDKLLKFYKNFQELVYLLEEMDNLESKLLKNDFADDFRSVKTLIQKHKSFFGNFKELFVQLQLCSTNQNIDEFHEKYNLYLALEESYDQLMQLHQFLWNIIEEEYWIKDKMEVISNFKVKCGLVKFHSTQHKMLENDLSAHETYLMNILRVGDELTKQPLFNQKNLQNKCNKIRNMWKELLEQASLYKYDLEIIKNYHQLFTFADGIDAWIKNTLNLVTNKDYGIDVETTEALLKKHEAITVEIKNYKGVIDALHKQADAFDPKPDILQRLVLIDNDYMNILEHSMLRQNKLLETLLLHEFLSKSSDIEEWLGIFRRYLDLISISSKNIDDLEMLKFFHERFEKNLYLNVTEIANFSQLGEKLEQFNCTKFITKKNTILKDWEELTNKSRAKCEEIQLAIEEENLNIECRETLIWIENKIRILETQKTSGWQVNQKELFDMQEKLNSLEKEISAMGKDYVKEQTVQLQIVLQRLQQFAEESERFQTFSNALGRFQSWVVTARVSIIPLGKISNSLIETKENLHQHNLIKEKLESRTYDYLKIVTYVKQLPDEPQYNFLRQQIEELKKDWDDLPLMWNKQQEYLLKTYNLQILEQDIRQAEFSLEKEEQYLSNIKLPRNITEAEELLEYHEKYLVIMEAYTNKVNEVLDHSKKLCVAKYLDSGHIKMRALNINERKLKNMKNALEWHEKLNTQVKLYQFLENCNDLLKMSVTTKKQAEIQICIKTIEILMHDGTELIKKIPDSQELLLKIKELSDLRDSMAQVRQNRPKTYLTGTETLKKSLKLRQSIFQKKKKSLHFCNEVEVEFLWMSEKMLFAKSLEFGNDLLQINALQRKNKWLQSKVKHRKTRINTICENGQKLIDTGCEDSDEFRRFINELCQMWQKLNESVEKRSIDLLKHERAQHYLLDACEAERWISEQELYVMENNIGQDQTVIYSQIRYLENIDSYAEIILSLHENSQSLNLEECPSLAKKVATKQSKLEQIYAGLKELAQKRKIKLEEASQLLSLNTDITNLNRWIDSKEMIASSDELGENYEHVIILCQKMKDFTYETTKFGNKQIKKKINNIADQFILNDHSDSAIIAEWKDQLNEVWQELLESIKIRVEILEASKQLHKFGFNWTNVLSEILKKQEAMEDGYGNNIKSTDSYLKSHERFLREIQIFSSQVVRILKDSAELQVYYAGDRAEKIISREKEVITAWTNLQQTSEQRKNKLVDTKNLFTFISLVKSNKIKWMKFITKKMNSTVNPCNVATAKLLIKKHQLLKAKIDATKDDFKACEIFGKELLSKNNFASAKIEEQLLMLNKRREALNERWTKRWDNLQLILEVSEFAQDAFLAERWLITFETYLQSNNVGRTTKETENLLKKHMIFEKLVALQENRFKALQCLTTFEIKCDKAEIVNQKQLDEKQLNAVEIVKSQSNDLKELESSNNDNCFEGKILRKHKCKKHRSKSWLKNKWHKAYAVLKNKQIHFYKHAKHAKLTSDRTFQKELPLDLKAAHASVVSDLKQGKLVFKLELENGCNYLFQVFNDTELHEWIEHINNCN